MNSSHNKAIEAKLMRLEPAESMPDFRVIWDRFIDSGGIPEVKKKIQWRLWFYKLVPVPVFALVAGMILLMTPFGAKPFMTEGEWFNRTDRYVKVNWKGHEAAISPGGHIRLAFPDKENRTVHVVLYSGKILCHPHRLNPGEKFIVLLSDAEISVNGTVFSVFVDLNIKRISVTEGVVQVSNAKGINDLRAGQTLEWTGQSAPRARTVDGLDLSDLSMEMSMDHRQVKKWSIRLPDSKNLLIARGENEILWAAEGPDLWKLNGPSGASRVFRETAMRNISRPSVDGGRVLIGNSLGGVWILQSSGKHYRSMPVSPGFRDLASPDLFGSYVVYPTLDAYLWVYDTESGRQHLIEAPEGDTIFGSAYVDPKRETLYFSTGSGKLFKYDIRSKKITGEVQVFSERIVFPVQKAGNSLFLIDRKTGAIAIVPINEPENKNVTIKPELAGMDNLPVVIQNKIYLFNSYDRKGKLFRVDAGVQPAVCELLIEFNDPIIAVSGYQNKILVTTLNGSIYYYSGRKFDRCRELSGKVIGADRNGFYMQDRGYLHYFSYDVIGADYL